MSSPRNNTNSDSVRIQIPDTHINTFLNQTKNGKDWKTQRICIKNILFHIGLYPNGKGKKYAGNIQFIVTPDKDNHKDSAIDYVAVYCQIYCPTLGIMFKGTKSLHKKTDILQLQLPKEEHQDIIIKNGIMFICHIEVLKIKYKSQSSVSGLTRKFSTSLKKKKRSRSSASSLSCGSLDSIDVFIPRTFHVKSSVNIEMVIDEKMSHPVYSEDINNMWCLSVIRNISTKKKKSRDEGRQLVINMIRLPHHDIRSIEVDYTVEIIPAIPQQSGQCIPVHIDDRNVLFSYKKTTETLDLFEVSKLDEFGGIYRLKMNIKIIRLYKDLGKNDKGREIKDSWSTFGIEREFQPETVQCSIDGQHHGKLTAYEPDDMKYSQHSTTNSDVVENISVFTSTSKSNNKSPQGSVDRKLSVSTHSSGTSNVADRTISITSLNVHDRIESPLQHISENKIEEVAIKHWDEIQQNDDNKQPDDNVFTKKFAHWLCEDVKLGQYLKNFQSKQWHYITMLEDFNDGTLVSVGITNEHHRKLILKEVKKFLKGQENFQQLMQTHPILKPFEKSFKDHNYWTTDELQTIKSQNDLCMIIDDHLKLNRVWTIIINLESILDEVHRKKKLEEQVNQIQRKQTQLVKDVRNHCTDLVKVYKQLQSEDKKSFEQIQQVDAMLTEVFREFKNHEQIYKAQRPSVSITSSSRGPPVSITSTTSSGPRESYDNSHRNNSNTDKDHDVVYEKMASVKDTVSQINSKNKT